MVADTLNVFDNGETRTPILIVRMDDDCDSEKDVECGC